MNKHLQILLALFFITPLIGQTTILDFEDPSTSTTFQYFGSSLEPGLTEIIPNPDQSGINTSATVGKYIKAANSQTWAGCFNNPPISIPISFVADSEVCMKVWFSAVGNVALKLEAGDLPNWVTTQEVNETETWTEICFNSLETSFEDPFQNASGGTYETLVLFFDFGNNSTEDVTYYFDDVITQGGGSQVFDVTLAVDMNNYTEPFTTVYASGEFNNWSGDANPMSDDDLDGIWTTTLSGLEGGLYEYKFTLDNWNAQEEFSGFEECTVTDPSGQFTNHSSKTVL